MPQTERSRAKHLWGVSIAICAWAILNWFWPPAPPHTGKWGWFNSLVASSLGWKGFAIVLLGVAGVIAALGLQRWRAASREEERRAG